MQTVVFTLIPWILDRVEDDKRGGVIIPLPFVIPAHAGIQGCWDDTIVIARKPPGMAEAIQWRTLLSFPRTRESRVSTITLPCRLRFLVQTNLFNCPVIQTLVFTLIPWILDRVEDDKHGGVIIPLPHVIPASE